MNIIVFSKSTEIYAPERILSEANKKGHNIENYFYKDLSIKIGPETVDVLYKGSKLKDADGVILRVSGAGLAGPLFVYQRVALIDYFPKSTFIVNRRTYLRWPRLNKLEQHFFMVRAGLPIVPSLSFASEDSIEWSKIVYPCVAKTSFGSSGQGVFKVDNKSQMVDLIMERGINNLIIQKFLPTRRDYRVIVVGGKALPQVMQKTATGEEFRTNFARGGMVEGMPLTEEMRKLAEDTARVFKADYAGIDIMYDEAKKPYILEINRGAQFQGFEESTGLNVAGEIVNLLERKYAKNPNSR